MKKIYLGLLSLFICFAVAGSVLAANEESEAKVIIDSGTNVNVILKNTGTKLNKKAQASAMAKYTTPLIKNIKNVKQTERYSLNNFIVYGTKGTKKLTMQKRYEMVIAFNKAVKKLPMSKADWVAVLKKDFKVIADVKKADNKATSTAPIQTKATSSNQYSLEQAMSDNAQLSTIAFSGLAFLTGSTGADSFFPPGKVADFFGFQYMRDVDVAGFGHNTTFLSRVANNVLYILNDEQKAKLLALAKEQAPIYSNFAYNRFPLMSAFRQSLSSTKTLDTAVASAYTSNLYKSDADLSYNRAVVVGQIINSFTDEQKAYLAKMQFNNYNTWPDVSEDATLKKNLTNNEFVALMTYASELFSWYKGSLTADVYFCPERHGTYFGGFYMKDYPAMNNPSYFISTAITGDSGQEFLKVLNTEQRALITGIITEQKAALTEIAQIRTTVSTELRKAMTGGTPDKAKVYSLIERYGALDGQMSALYAQRFAAVNKTLTDTQRTALVKLRNLTVVPQGAYRFSTPVSTPEIPSTDFFFDTGTMPSTAGQTTAPTTFITENSGK
ncbi:MAG: Spy/CpxP family protein refolding chaperone [bacterium]